MPPYIRRTKRQPAAGHRRGAGRARPPHRRHHPADARGARGGRQPVRRAHVDPGAVRPGAGADGAAVLVSVADHRAADPAAGRRRGATCARARAAPAACRRRCWSGATRSARWPRALSDSAAALWARMDAIERFAADVAHEIKNPLSSIRSAIETLRRIEDPARQQQLLAIIAAGRDAAGPADQRRQRRLAARCRAVARRGRAGGRGADPARPCRNWTRRRATDERSAARGGRAGRRAWWCWAVEDRLVQVLRNLIGNAQSFSPPRGRIALRAREAGGMVEISVEDDGPGIPDGEPGADLRPVLFRAPAGREIRPAFRPGPVDQPADRRGAARPDHRREPQGDRATRAGRALRGAAAEGVATPSLTPAASPSPAAGSAHPAPAGTR